MCRFVRPAVDWAKIDCRSGPRAGCAPRALGLGPHRAPRALLLTPWGPEDRERRAPDPPPQLPAARAHTQTAGLQSWTLPKMHLNAPPTRTQWKSWRIWTFHLASFLSGSQRGSYDHSWFPRSPRAWDSQNQLESWSYASGLVTNPLHEVLSPFPADLEVTRKSPVGS